MLRSHKCRTHTQTHARVRGNSIAQVLMGCSCRGLFILAQKFGETTIKIEKMQKERFLYKKTIAQILHKLN
jgi:hypothetical protein